MRPVRRVVARWRRGERARREEGWHGGRAVWQKETQRKLYSVLLIKETTLFLYSLVHQARSGLVVPRSRLFFSFLADAARRALTGVAESAHDKGKRRKVVAASIANSHPHVVICRCAICRYCISLSSANDRVLSHAYRRYISHISTEEKTIWNKRSGEILIASAHQCFARILYLKTNDIFNI